jgi:hypothetical protein
MARLARLSLFLTCLVVGSNLFAATYYIDYAGGNDSNNGTSKSSPWQHAPGMNGCTGNCDATSPKAGDSVILKGGVTWPNAAFPITWKWSGTSGAPIYVGVDQTWYIGSSWARPIFNAGGIPIAGSKDEYIWSPSVSYVTWDNIELTGLHWDTTYAYGSLGCAYWGGSANHITISNFYVHGWSHTGTADNFACIMGTTGGDPMTGNLITLSVFDGSDSTGGGDSGAMMYPWSNVTYSIFHDIPNAVLLGGHGKVGNNLIYNIKADFDGVSHANAMEEISEDSGTSYIHDNVYHDIFAESAFLGGNTAGHTIYAWNNLFYNLQNSPPIQLEGRNHNWTGYFWNNTFIPISGGQCFALDSATATLTINLTNNHCITTGVLDNIAAMAPSDPLTKVTNFVMTPTQAAAAGYTSSQTYAYSPTTTNCSGQQNCPVGAGTNLASSWPSGYSTGDTIYACTQSASNQVVCPARTSQQRSTTWDAGAYEFGGAPAPPTNLVGVAQ